MQDDIDIVEALRHLDSSALEEEYQNTKSALEELQAEEKELQRKIEVLAYRMRAIKQEKNERAPKGIFQHRGKGKFIPVKCVIVARKGQAVQIEYKHPEHFYLVSRLLRSKDDLARLEE